MFEVIKNLFSVELKPKELEERFRLESFPRDKTQITIVMIFTLIIILGFLGLEISLLKYREVYPSWIPSRIVASIASVVAIGIVHRQSSPKLIDRVTFAWGLVILLHMVVINLIRPQDYIPVTVWDIFTICGIYFLLPLPFPYKILLAFLLTGSSVTIWVINRVHLVYPYESIAVLEAYFFSNAYGIFVTVRHERARWQNYIVLTEERKSKNELSTRTRELERTQEDLRLIAMTDPLTGISNRRHFMDQISEEFERTIRYGTPFSLMLIDIDNLKEVNDTYGHEAGDEVLRSFAKYCLTRLRSVDRFARFGGDEFIVLLVQTGREKAKEVAVRLISGIEGLEIQTEKEAIHITMSVGLTTINKDATIDGLIKRADKALYEAKNGGRNRVAIL